MRSVDFGTVIFGCTAWVPLLLWISVLVQWMISNEIEIISGIAGIGVGLGLGIIAMSPPAPFLQPLAFLTIWVTVALFPFVRHALMQRELKGVDVHAMERAYEVLGQRPRDVMGRFRLAQTAWTLGMTGHAMRIAEECLQELDPKVFMEEHVIVRRWHRHQPTADMFVDYSCMDCHGACPPGKTHCPTCGAPFLLDRAKGKVFNKGTFRKIVAAWIAGIAALAGIPWATTLSGAAAFGAIIAILGLSFLVVFLSFRPKGRLA